MAELVFNLADVTLDSSWTVTYYAGQYMYSGASSESASRTVAISGIPDGENVKRAMLSATLNRVGTTDYSERITVNGLNFSTATRTFDTSAFANGTDWTANFYFQASGEAHGYMNNNSATTYSCSLYLSNITLTLTTGTGAAFDGLIGSLPEGTKILIDEPDGNQGYYALVNHDYNTGKALLWQDAQYTTSTFNSGSAKFIDGILDTYLNTTFYEGLPDTAKPYIVAANYPTLTNHVSWGGTVEDLERYVCTPSARELFDGAGSAEGTLLMYLETVPSASAAVYWTRSMVSDTSATNARYVNAAGDDYFSISVERSYGVRPCFCVLEEQLVTPGDADATYYVLASAVDAPADVYLNGTAADLSGQQRDTAATLSWDAVASTLVTGYEVWRCDTVDGEYAFFGAVTAADDGTIPTELTVRTGGKGFATAYYKVKAVTTPDTDYLDSDRSANYRSMATKRTNVHYYDGTRWLLAMPNHYDGGWTQTEGMKYYDGSQWIVPET